MWLGGTAASQGVVVSLVSTVQDNPNCLWHGETYLYETTWKVEKIGDPCYDRHLIFAIGVGVIDHVGLGNNRCGQYPATGGIVFNSSASYTCSTPAFWPGPWADFPCDESSSPPSSSSGSVPISEPSGPVSSAGA